MIDGSGNRRRSSVQALLVLLLVSLAVTVNGDLSQYQQPDSKTDTKQTPPGVMPFEDSPSKTDMNMTMNTTLDMNMTMNATMNATTTIPFERDPSSMNILIIGSEQDSSKYFWQDRSKAFPPTPIVGELQAIIQGGLDSNPNLSGDGGITNVNVVLEDRYNFYWGGECFNLATWFHWPFPEDIETTTRWPNLRNEGPMEWDYIVLIGDPYTMEYMPGLYTHGVALVAEEVAKAPGKAAEVVLLMPWPNPRSISSVDHYKEVVYRTGRSGGLKVAPAALAWQAAGSPTDTTDHAYIAAASIYSRIWGNAAGSSYNKQQLAQTIDNTVMANQGVAQYTGKFTFQSSFAMFNIKGPGASIRKTAGGTSTESGFTSATRAAITRTGAILSEPIFYIGRKTWDPQGIKDFRNQGTEVISFGYEYQLEAKTDYDVTFVNIFSKDIVLAQSMMGESDTFRVIPRRLMAARGVQAFPDMPLKSDGTHLSSEANTFCASYMYTIISGRCPVDHQPDTVTSIWYAQKIGYETAWQLATCQVRAPGFKVKPAGSNLRVPTGTDEQVTVEFLNPPTADVTVTVVSGTDGVTVSPETLTFTPDNYNVIQSVAIKAGEKTQVEVQFRTASVDEVFHDLDDAWQLTLNTPPIAETLPVEVIQGGKATVPLKGTDADGDRLTYSIVDQPFNGNATIIEATEADKNVYAEYTPDPEYVGFDFFTFAVHDGFEDTVAEMDIEVQEAD